MMQWLKVADLVIDDDYQRDLRKDNWTAIRRIAGRFQWSRFSPVFVAPVEGGKYAIIDGQHRTHAAALCGIEAVPCQVVQMTKEEQAASFAAVNGLVTKVTPWHILKAAVAAGEAWALDCRKVCADANCVLMMRNGSTADKKPGEIYALALVRNAVKNGHHASVTLALSGLRRSEFGKEAEAYNNEILKPLFAAVVDRPWLAKAGIDLAPFLDRFDIYTAIDRAAQFAKIKRRQGATGISHFDLTAADIGEGLDKAFPQRMAMPTRAAA
jgi:hypothetical protein